MNLFFVIFVVVTMAAMHLCVIWDGRREIWNKGATDGTGTITAGKNRRDYIRK